MQSDCGMGSTACQVLVVAANITDMEWYGVHAFLGLGIFYYVISIVDQIRWWNGSDENGDPK